MAEAAPEKKVHEKKEKKEKKPKEPASGHPVEVRLSDSSLAIDPLRN